ncbi:hypothetical protein KPL78_01290 [Roseomonas sp. HJA6]|uniref:J domain-containing protein n=1 Tax=Roseomonas alba TaxID=2846776 RepID=A0ABS7A553_9PROT|nr:hypothetical protein [Neoroseomonas alba]MBW6396455.1 hypothetical protein [Neoroseomonas alba]
MSEAVQALNRRSIANWPSARLLDFAESNAHDQELLEYILAELSRRDVDVAVAAAQRVAALIGGTSALSERPAADGGPEVAALKARLDQAERRAREAEARAATAERALACEPLPSRGGTLMRRVHLADTAPGWLVDAARRAFRLRFHPDRFADPLMKARAEETFKEAEDVFRQIATGQ